VVPPHRERWIWKQRAFLTTKREFDCGAALRTISRMQVFPNHFANQRSAFPIPIVAAICCDAYHSDKGKTYCGFNVGVSDRFVGLSADYPLKSYASPPAGVNRHGWKCAAVDCPPPPYDLPLMLAITCGDPKPFALHVDQCRRDLQVVAPQVGRRTFAKLCR
jgi:hypothetical protein